MSRMTRRRLIGALPGLGLAASTAHAQQLNQQTGTRVTPQEEPMDALDAWIDEWGRPTAKVMLNGQGPFRFMVDTGSTTTVLSQRIAALLQAPVVGVAMVNGTTGAAEMPITELAKLETGAVTKERVRVAVLSNDGLGNEAGILGADVFEGRRLTFDITAKSVRVEPSRRGVRGVLRPNMRIRNGLLAEVDGRIGGVKAKLMLDTGAQHCIMNPRLSNDLSVALPRLRRHARAKVIGVTGHILEGDYIELPRIDMDKVEIRDAGAVAADAPIFRLWQLQDEPAMIVGVDVLSRLAGFSIDYGARLFDADPMASLIARGGSMLG